MTQVPAGRPSPAPDGDDLLMSRVGDGDTEALESLYQRYGSLCYSLARRVIGDDMLAQDVVQEVFLSVWRDPARFDAARGGFSSYLLAIAHHKAVDVVRREENRRKRRAPAEAMDERQSDARPVDDEVWISLRRERVREALAYLPDAQREALLLGYFGGYSQREIADSTGTPLGTVKTRMLAGMRTLRELLAAPLGLDAAPRPARGTNGNGTGRRPDGPEHHGGGAS